jgi:hypothetical protein
MVAFVVILYATPKARITPEDDLTDLPRTVRVTALRRVR